MDFGLMSYDGFYTCKIWSLGGIVSWFSCESNISERKVYIKLYGQGKQEFKGPVYVQWWQEEMQTFTCKVDPLKMGCAGQSGEEESGKPDVMRLQCSR